MLLVDLAGAVAEVGACVKSSLKTMMGQSKPGQTYWIGSSVQLGMCMPSDRLSLVLEVAIQGLVERKRNEGLHHHEQPCAPGAGQLCLTGGLCRDIGVV